MYVATENNWAFIAMGSNIGDGVEQLRRARCLLEPLASTDIRCSSLWETEPVDMVEADWFVNAVVGFATPLSVMELLEALQDIERRCGRASRHGRNEARTLDLDIVTFGDHIVSEPRLRVPHPRACKRLFVLLPLAELAPEFRFPGDGVMISTLIQQAPKMKLRKLSQRIG